MRVPASGEQSTRLLSLRLAESARTDRVDLLVSADLFSRLPESKLLCPSRRLQCPPSERQESQCACGLHAEFFQIGDPADDRRPTYGQDSFRCHRADSGHAHQHLIRSRGQLHRKPRWIRERPGNLRIDAEWKISIRFVHDFTGGKSVITKEIVSLIQAMFPKCRCRFS